MTVIRWITRPIQSNPSWVYDSQNNASYEERCQLYMNQSSDINFFPLEVVKRKQLTREILTHSKRDFRVSGERRRVRPGLSSWSLKWWLWYLKYSASFEQWCSIWISRNSCEVLPSLKTTLAANHVWFKEQLMKKQEDSFLWWNVLLIAFRAMPAAKVWWRWVLLPFPFFQPRFLLLLLLFFSFYLFIPMVHYNNIK